MRRLRLFFALCLYSCVASCFAVAAENETPVESQITSLGVFKNGVLVVQEEVSFPGPGRYVLESPPAPIHGTFFLNGDSGLVVT
ncbi:MAG: hypothetical protein Q4G59_11245, partial [Planctomycetia bacterium]|nr:hypothetical protein [Planctomycetia bacterium]